MLCYEYRDFAQTTKVKSTINHTFRGVYRLPPTHLKKNSGPVFSLLGVQMILNVAENTVKFHYSQCSISV